MGIIVQKFGGSSVADKEKLLNVCKHIIKEYEKNNKVVVVVSAQGKTTDKLVLEEKEISLNPNKREHDVLVSTGEQITISKLAIYLNELGYNAISYTGWQIPIITDDCYGNANIIDIKTEKILKELEDNKIVVVAGFQGIDKFGHITTLGRGGSDLSAVAIAASLKASRCEIYTDVDGVFSADPNIIKNAKLLDTISYDEMLEAATSGAKVLHNRAVSLSKKYRLKVSVRNTRGNLEGTLVEDGINESYKMKILSIQKELAKITIIGEHMYSNGEYISKIYELASKNNIVIHMLSLSEISLGLIVNQNVAENFAKLIHDNIM